jgi:hypothetical protein
MMITSPTDPFFNRAGATERQALLDAPLGSYVLSFEDTRYPDGSLASYADMSFRNPDLLVQFLGNNQVAIVALGGGGGFRWDLVALANDTVLMPDLLKYGSPAGSSVTVAAPEPATLSLLAIGGLAMIRRRARR